MFMNFEYYLVIFAIGLGYIFYLFIVYWQTRVPYVTTPKKYLAKLLAELPITNYSIIYDLGSGKGDFVFAAEKYHPGKIVCYELSPLHVFYSRLKAKLIKSRAEFYRQDFLSADLSQVDIVYLFLVQPAIDKLWPKLKAEMKSGAWIVVLSDRLPELRPTKIIDNPVHDSQYFCYQLRRG